MRSSFLLSMQTLASAVLAFSSSGLVPSHLTTAAASSIAHSCDHQPSGFCASDEVSALQLSHRAPLAPEQNRSKFNGRRLLVLFERQGNTTRVDLDPPGPSLGDLSIWENTLWNKWGNVRLGRTQGTCFLTNVAKSLYECQYTLLMGSRGHISVQGPWRVNRSTHLTVNGGAGRYWGVKGGGRLFTLRRKSPATYLYIFSLQHPPTLNQKWARRWLRHKNFSLIERDESLQTIDMKPGGAYIGDLSIVWHNSLWRDGRRAGYTQGSCVNTNLVANHYECSYTFFLKRGQLSVQGPWTVDPTVTMAVTGGTKYYSTARGSVIRTILNTTTPQLYKYEFALHL